VITTATHTVTYDRSSQNWSTNQDVNMLFLRNVENYINDRLSFRGNVFLNEIFDELGLPRTSKGATDGWLLSNGNTIQFNPSPPDKEGAITLTFHTDGVIYDKIEATR
jgi:hypothetical protein